MSPSYWGPNTWEFFHTATIQMKEESFPLIGNTFISILRTICMHLPCPECSEHAKEFWRFVRIENIQTKQDMINLIFVFHNMVNKRKRAPLFLHENLIPKYGQNNLVHVYSNFVKTFHTKGNMQQLNESFHRNIMLSQLRLWMLSNLQHFQKNSDFL